jgi:nitroreductase
MDIYNLILKRRTIRRFAQTPVPRPVLEKLVNAARLAPSAANLQPCEYVVVDENPLVEKVFETLRWAAYIAPQGNPSAAERPVAYIVVIVNEEKKGGYPSQDAAAAIENMILLALSEGIGSCWIGSIEREKLSALLAIPAPCQIDSVLAMGYPAENPVTEDLILRPSVSTLSKSRALARGTSNGLTDSVKYWKDKEGRLHVPKRKLEDVLHWQKYKK